MRHLKTNIRSKVPRYEQTRFGGIEQGKAMGDESIYDLFDISTDDFPILSTVDNRRTGSDKYDNPIYYGMADKPYVIAGNEEGMPFELYKGDTAYNAGDTVLYCGDIYVCKQGYSKDSDNAKAVPAANQTNWELYTQNTFSYDGEIRSGVTFRVNGIYHYEDKWYICKKEHSYGALADESLWKKQVPDWGKYGGEVFRGRFKSSRMYYPKDVVYQYTSDGLVIYVFISETPYKNTSLSNSERWNKTELTIPVYSSEATYALGDVVSKDKYPDTEDSFYVKISDNDNPASDSEMWAPYSCSFLYYNGKKVEGIQLIPGKKVCSYLNGKICIFPDKVYYDVIDEKFGHMKGNYSGYFTFNYYTDEPSISGYYDNGYASNRQLRWYMSDSAKYIEGATGSFDTLSLWWTSAEGDTHASQHGNIDLKQIFSDGDILRVEMNGNASDIYTSLVDGYYIIREVGSDYLRFDSQTFAGITLGSSTITSGRVTFYELYDPMLSKDVPDMDMLCVSQNRMWGAKDNTVYACALGNCLNWQSYTGLDTDAVAFDCGTIGVFTSCTEYGNYPVFFKENEFYRVYGSTVSEYSLTRIANVGVDKDSPYSVAEINSTLIMHSPNGIYAYSGGIPSIISENFKGDIKSCIASTDGFKYYAMATIDGKRRLYVYDLAKRIWTSESGLEVIGFITYENCLRCLTQSGVEVELSGHSDWGTVESDVTEEAIIEFNDFYGGGIGHKEVSRIIVRASVEPRYNPLHIYIQYESDGMWHRVMKIYNQNSRKKVAEAGFALRKCDHFRLRFACQGKFSLYSVAREYIDNE